VLDLLASLEVRATFFVLGWAASRHGRAVRRIVEAGHEAACHGSLHRRVAGMGPRAFREDVREGRRAVEDATGVASTGFRAPMWSIGRKKWPYEILAEEGFLYSSSRLAVPFLGGGRAGGPRRVAGTLEVPALRLPWRGAPLPIGGTFFLRRLPVSLLRAGRDEVLSKGDPAVFWLHPFELDLDGPRLALDPLRRVLRFSGLPGLPERLRRLVGPGDRRVEAWVLQKWGTSPST
jgi:polysaccharide deacetylase family protein (PEP-CTERM system associated)